MQFYQSPNRPDHEANNAEFARIVKEFPGLQCFKPNPKNAPWHFQALITGSGAPVIVNFWPHKMKVQRDQCASYEGAHAVRRVIAEAFDDADTEPVDVLEDFDLARGW